MPVDYELAYESLKWIDPKVYRMYLRLRYRKISKEAKSDTDFLKRLYLIARTNDALHPN